MNVWARMLGRKTQEEKEQEALIEKKMAQVDRIRDRGVEKVEAMGEVLRNTLRRMGESNDGR